MMPIFPVRQNPHLRGQAERIRRRVGNEDRFDQLSVLESQQKLGRAIRRRFLADEFGREDPEAGGERGTEVTTEIGHLGEIGDAALVDPLEELARVEARLPHRLERLLELGELHFHEIVPRCIDHDERFRIFHCTPGVQHDVSARARLRDRRIA
jgi:hypothetical protein